MVLKGMQKHGSPYVRLELAFLVVACTPPIANAATFSSPPLASRYAQVVVWSGGSGLWHDSSAWVPTWEGGNVKSAEQVRIGGNDSLVTVSAAAWTPGVLTVGPRSMLRAGPSSSLCFGPMCSPPPSPPPALPSLPQPYPSAPASRAPPPVARRCASWCASSPKPPSVKCGFAGCNGCGFCEANAPPPPPPPYPIFPPWTLSACESWCDDHANHWWVWGSNGRWPKCLFVVDGIRACALCPPCLSSPPSVPHVDDLPPSPPEATPQPRPSPCAGWCASNPKPENQKCGFAGCSGCGFCESSI